MNRQPLAVLVGFLAAGLLAAAASAAEAREKAKEEHHAGGPHEQCARACAECMRECESCARHCAHMLEEGHKEHIRTLGTCADCGDVCAVAAKVVSREGPMTRLVCEGCAKACDECAEACNKHPDDEHMKRCARACHECARACRDMLRHHEHDD